MPRTSMAAAALVILLAVVLLWTQQRRLIYFPMGDVPPAAQVGLADAQEVAFETSDGLELHGWFVSANGGSAPSHSAPAVLVFNGNAGNRAYRAPLAAALRRHGFHVLLADYRGYGGNPGRPSQTGLSADSRAARAFLLTRSDVDPARLIYFGESLGAAVALELAAQHPPAALILRSPFTSMVEVGQHHYPFLPVRLLLRDSFDSLRLIGELRAPLLVIAGDRDAIVPFDQSRRLYNAAAEPKEFIAIRGADHNDAELLMGDEMIGAIVAFVDRHAREPR
jgi:uncharacterized protein